ncbi:MAG: hypothetical protein ACRDHN_04900 [Thermomicrobiales bacterium]
MNDDEILSEIRRTREGHASACGFDVLKLMAFYREQQPRYPDPAHPVVSFIGAPPRELSFVSPEAQGAEPWEGDEIITEIRATRRKLIIEREAESCVVREDPPKP